MSYLLHRRKAFRQGVTYDFTETFEGSELDSQSVAGYDNTGWISDNPSNDPNRATNPAPLQGDSSMYLQASTARDVYNTIGPYSEVWVALRTHIPSNVGSFAQLVNLRDSGGADVGQFRIRTSDRELRLHHGSVTSATSGTDFIPFDVDLFIWLRWKKGTGSDGELDAYVSRTSVRPSISHSMSNGNSTADVAQIELVGSGGNIQDDLIVDASEIGSNPWANLHSDWKHQLAPDGTTGQTVGNAAANTYAFGSFIAAFTGEVTKFELDIDYNGTPTTETIDASIYSDDGAGDPNAAITNGTISSINISSLPSAGGNYHPFTYSGSMPSLTAGTRYHIVIKANQIDGTHNATLRYSGSSAHAEAFGRGDATPTWTTIDATAGIDMKIYGNH